MTRALRTRHRRIVLGLALVLPASLGVALASRPSAPRVASALPEGAAGATEPLGEALRVALDDLRLDLRLERTRDEVAAVVRATAVVGAPELLLYASDDDAAGAEGLPRDARLAGVVPFGAPGRIRLASGARHAPAHLLVYDLAHARVVARVALPGGDAGSGGPP